LRKKCTQAYHFGDIFFWELPSPLYHTPPLDANGASPPPYWNPNYATGWLLAPLPKC